MLKTLRIAGAAVSLFIGSGAGFYVMAQPVTTPGTPCPSTVIGNDGSAAQKGDCKQAVPGESMSSHLSNSGGTITPPPSVDPSMAKRPPETGAPNTPVIPPPGSPGGNPNIIPK
jgi:hypothetical protein